MMVKLATRERINRMADTNVYEHERDHAPIDKTV
jgi:hypothetical protein